MAVEKSKLLGLWFGFEFSGLGAVWVDMSWTEGINWVVQYGLWGWCRFGIIFGEEKFGLGEFEFDFELDSDWVGDLGWWERLGSWSGCAEDMDGREE